ncbi:unnamed protein product [Soboliphyme baturini]|uniref:Metacaspase-1 n=1 Tax=Soboliphyme baturini TaxID=241478 RepID=A0A183IX36_9BILA|nr:unnamed protein product [Soboliphyme baturini]
MRSLNQCVLELHSSTAGIHRTIEMINWKLSERNRNSFAPTAEEYQICLGCKQIEPVAKAFVRTGCCAGSAVFSPIERRFLSVDHRNHHSSKVCVVKANTTANMSYPPYPPSDPGYVNPSSIGLRPADHTIGWNVPGGAAPSAVGSGQGPTPQVYPYSTGQDQQTPVRTLSYNPGVSAGMKSDGTNLPYPGSNAAPQPSYPVYPGGGYAGGNTGGYPQGYPQFGSSENVPTRPVVYPAPSYPGAYPASNASTGYPRQQFSDGQGQSYGGTPPVSTQPYGQGSMNLPYGGAVSNLSSVGQQPSTVPYAPGSGSARYGQQSYQSGGSGNRSTSG